MADVPFTPELFAELKVIQERQSEINRRMGVVEELVKNRSIDPARLADLEARLEAREENKRDWVKLGLQSLFGIAITTAAVWVGGKLGLTVAW